MPRLRLQNTLLAGFLLLAAEPGASQSDRASEGLIGPVSSVRIEVAVFSRVGGEWVEGAREPLAAFHFDEEGYRTDESRDPRESRVETPEVRRSYDSSGRVLEELTSDSLGLVSRATYDYDLHGRLVERILYYPDGRTRKVRELHTYDLTDGSSRPPSTRRTIPERESGAGSTSTTTRETSSRIRPTRPMELSWTDGSFTTCTTPSATGPSESFSTASPPNREASPTAHCTR